MRNESVKTDVITIKALLSLNLAIPDYQRPYKWDRENVEQLLQDLEMHQQKRHYRLGTIVLYRQKDSKEDYQADFKAENPLEIVDGQQRILTLLLLMKVIIECDKNYAESSKFLSLNREESSLEAIVERQLEALSFNSSISKINLAKNYQTIQRLVNRPEFTAQTVQFILNDCEVVCFELNDLSEAFQFFDSQNSRGKDLNPHDLLKAFHLREFSIEEEALKQQAVDDWEAYESKELARLFENYLYRIREWIKGNSARYFTKDDVHLFKGVNLDKDHSIPLSKPLRILHHYVDQYNRQLDRKIDNNQMIFPFQLDQVIMNGRRFFEMMAHYQHLNTDILGIAKAQLHLTARASLILHCLNTYKKRSRDGDRYVRMLFDCALMFFIDKFGNDSVSNAIEKIFIWAYSCRLQQSRVQLATIDNYACGKHPYYAVNIFKHFHEAMTARDALSFKLRKVRNLVGSKDDYKFDEDNSMENLFQELGYLGS